MNFYKNILQGAGRKILNILRDSYTDVPTTARVNLGLQMWRTLRYRSASIGIPITKNERIISHYHDLHKGKRAFIIGNGPSLNNCDLTLLKDEITFGVNSIFLARETTGFWPTYYIVEDIFVAEDRAEQINNYHYPKQKFFGNYLKHCIVESPDISWLNVRFRYDEYENFPHFSMNALRMIWTGGTVSYICLQLAYYMGFSTVYLIGFDHSYKIPVDGIAKGTEILSQSDDLNHFHPDYFGRGFRWHDPRVDRMEKAYIKAKKYFEMDNRRIYNATVGGKLEVFERVDYKKIFLTTWK